MDARVGLPLASVIAGWFLASAVGDDSPLPRSVAGAGALAAAPWLSIDTDHICEVLTGEQQRELNIREAELMDEEKGGASCYHLMTDDSDADVAGYTVSYFPSRAALFATVDGTDAIPEKAEPLAVADRIASRQVTYGDTWAARLSIDVGDGAVLYVERYGPKNTVAEGDLRDKVVDVAELALANVGPE